MGVMTEREKQKYFAYLDGVADGLKESRNDINSVLEQIRDEIEHWESDDTQDDYQMGAMDMQNYVLRVIDKYTKGEQE